MMGEKKPLSFKTYNEFYEACQYEIDEFLSSKKITDYLVVYFIIKNFGFESLAPVHKSPLKVKKEFLVKNMYLSNMDIEEVKGTLRYVADAFQHTLTSNLCVINFPTTPFDNEQRIMLDKKLLDMCKDAHKYRVNLFCNQMRDNTKPKLPNTEIMISYVSYETEDRLNYITFKMLNMVSCHNIHTTPEICYNPITTFDIKRCRTDQKPCFVFKGSYTGPVIGVSDRNLYKQLDEAYYIITDPENRVETTKKIVNSVLTVHTCMKKSSVFIPHHILEQYKTFVQQLVNNMNALKKNNNKHSIEEI